MKSMVMHPNDWVEKIYSKHSVWGEGSMLVINFCLFGIIGCDLGNTNDGCFFAAGVINGIGHFVGYRNLRLRTLVTTSFH